MGLEDHWEAQSTRLLVLNRLIPIMTMVSKLLARSWRHFRHVRQKRVKMRQNAKKTGFYHVPRAYCSFSAHEIGVTWRKKRKLLKKMSAHIFTN